MSDALGRREADASTAPGCMQAPENELLGLRLRVHDGRREGTVDIAKLGTRLARSQFLDTCKSVANQWVINIHKS